MLNIASGHKEGVAVRSASQEISNYGFYKDWCKSCLERTTADRNREETNTHGNSVNGVRTSKGTGEIDNRYPSGGRRTVETWRDEDWRHQPGFSEGFNLPRPLGSKTNYCVRVS